MNSLKITVFALCLLLIASCKKPNENIKLVVDTNIIQYTAMVNVRDANTGLSVNTANIQITGTNADKIYELSGKKDIKLVNGMVTIGLHPDLEPTSDKPIAVNVEISAPGYVSQSKVVSFIVGRAQQVLNINLSKVGAPPAPVIPEPEPIYKEVSMSFTGVCPNRTDFQIRPSVYIYFKKTGTEAPFQYLGYLDKGNLTTKFLELNATYDFQIVFGGSAYTVTQKIEESSYDLTVQMPGACDGF